MNCDTYLSMLATLPVADLEFGDARHHAAGCRDCDRVTRVVTERERTMLMAFEALYPSAPAATIAASAVITSRRRRVALYYRTALGVLTAASVVFLIQSRQRSAAAPVQLRETFRLQCLSPEQAVQVIRSTSARDVVASIWTQSPVGIITVAASPKEMARVRALLDRYDSAAESQCGVQLTLPRMITVPPE